MCSQLNKYITAAVCWTQWCVSWYVCMLTARKLRKSVAKCKKKMHAFEDSHCCGTNNFLMGNPWSTACLVLIVTLDGCWGTICIPQSSTASASAVRLNQKFQLSHGFRHSRHQWECMKQQQRLQWCRARCACYSMLWHCLSPGVVLLVGLI